MHEDVYVAHAASLRASARESSLLYAWVKQPLPLTAEGKMHSVLQEKWRLDIRSKVTFAILLFFWNCFLLQTELYTMLSFCLQFKGLAQQYLNLTCHLKQ